MKKIMMIAGEVSGDLHGANLFQELKRNFPQIKAFGVGGEKMRQAGIDVRFDIGRRGSVGIFETFKHLPFHAYLFFVLKKMMDLEKPDLLLLIDYQGFNMVLAKTAKKKNIKTVYYLAPQEWLWGTEKNGRKVAKTLDKIIAVFPQEADFYRRLGADVTYVGSPVYDYILETEKVSKADLCRELKLNPNQPLVGLFPGSRTQEIELLLPILLESAKKIKKSISNVQFVLPISSMLFKAMIEREVFTQDFPIVITEKNGSQILRIIDLAITASGTVTLEGAFTRTPMIVIYKISPLTYFTARNILRIKTPFISMPNILADKEIFPELIQENANPDAVCEKVLSFFNSNGRINEIKEELYETVEKLAKPGAIKKAAEVILKCLLP
jgi:lipid-A-disaccharide synthase